MSNEQTNAKPWYRHPWVWFIIALPAAAVVAGLSTVVIAVINQDSLVRDDWYKEGKAINQSIARDTAATRIGLAADVRMDALTGEVVVHLRHTAPDVAPPAQLTLDFSHPTQARSDQRLVLQQRDGEYRGQLQQALQGRFHVELGSSDWRVTGERTFPLAEFSLTHE